MILLALCLSSSAATPPAVVSAEPVPALDARFSRTDGWVGADGAYSVPVSGSRTLWLFSDTWVGSVRDGRRQNVVLVNNSVAVQEGPGPDTRFAFTVGHAADGKPAALFAPPDGRGWFWLFAGAAVDRSLYIFMPRFEKTAGGGAFGFKQVDLWLGQIENRDKAPTAWRTKYAKVPFAELAADRKRSYGSAVLRVEDQVYIYGFDEKPGKPFPSRQLSIAQVPADKLPDFDSWRFFKSGEWTPEAKEATGLCDGLATEFSVSYLPDLKQYALVYTDRGLSDRIVGRFAPTPTGPWSVPVLLYKCPEMKQRKGVFSYAAKAHPHLAAGNELVISYVVNAFELTPVLDDAELYRPRFVRVVLKAKE